MPQPTEALARVEVLSPAAARALVSAEIVALAEEVRSRADAYVIRTAADAAGANELAENSRQARRIVIERIGESVAAADRAHKDLVAARDSLLNPFAAAEKTINDKLLAWNERVRERQRQIAEAEAQREREEADRRRTEDAARRETLATKAESVGDPVGAAELRAFHDEPPVITKAPAAAPAASSLKAIAPNASVRRTWKIDRAHAMRPGTEEVSPETVKRVLAFISTPEGSVYRDLLTIDFDAADAWAVKHGHDDGATDFPPELVAAGIVPIHSAVLARRRRR